jgi:hypothetical protein
MHVRRYRGEVGFGVGFSFGLGVKARSQVRFEMRLAFGDSARFRFGRRAPVEMRLVVVVPKRFVRVCPCRRGSRLGVFASGRLDRLRCLRFVGRGFGDRLSDLFGDIRCMRLVLFGAFLCFALGLSFGFRASLSFGLLSGFALGLCFGFGFGFGLRAGLCFSSLLRFALGLRFGFGASLRFGLLSGLALSVCFSLSFRTGLCFSSLLRFALGLRFRFLTGLSFGLRSCVGTGLERTLAVACGLLIACRSRFRRDGLRACVRVELIASCVENFLAVSAACEPTGHREQGFLHAENRFAVGTAGG